MVQTINGERGEIFKFKRLEFVSEPFKSLEKMTGEEIIVKNDIQYHSSNWIHYALATVSAPIQRKLTMHECVFDFDKIDASFKNFIIEYLKSKNLYFIAYDSSENGLHVHFWTNFSSKSKKRQLVEMLSKIINDDIGVQIDLLPMSHGFVRAENSVHPVKGCKKTFRCSNIDNIYINDFGDTLNVNANSEPKISITSHLKDNGHKHGCIKYIESNKFIDGRKRLMFCLISYYKNTVSEKELANIVSNWCKKQDLYMPKSHIYAMSRSNRGIVGCNYRHQLLEELGHSFVC